MSGAAEFVLLIKRRIALSMGLAAIGMSYLVVALIAQWASDAEAAHMLRLGGLVLPIAALSLCWSVVFLKLLR